MNLIHVRKTVPDAAAVRLTEETAVPIMQWTRGSLYLEKEKAEDGSRVIALRFPVTGQTDPEKDSSSGSYLGSGPSPITAIAHFGDWIVFDGASFQAVSQQDMEVSYHRDADANQ